MKQATARARNNPWTIVALLAGAAIGASVTYSSGISQPTVTCHDHVVTTSDQATLTWRNGWTETMDKSLFLQLLNDGGGTLLGAGFVDLSIPGMDTDPTVTFRPGIQLFHESVCDVLFAAQGAPHEGKYITGGKGG